MDVCVWHVHAFICKGDEIVYDTFVRRCFCKNGTPISIPLKLFRKVIHSVQLSILRKSLKYRLIFLFQKETGVQPSPFRKRFRGSGKLGFYFPPMKGFFHWCMFELVPSLLKILIIVVSLTNGNYIYNCVFITFILSSVHSFSHLVEGFL